MKRMLIVGALCGLIVAPTHAQMDDSVWPQFRANDEKTGSVLGAPGPAVELQWTIDSAPIPAPGGFSVGSDGSVYYKSHDDDGCWVFRIDPDTGDILDQSPNLTGALGAYSGIAVGENFLYTTVFRGEGDTSVIRLNKSDLTDYDEWTNPAFLGLRGTPLISKKTHSTTGNHTLYVVDRNAILLHAVDAANGDLLWSYDLGVVGSFGAVGPMWTLSDGREAIAHFGNAPFFGGSCVADNRDGTFEELWIGGPDSFNWWGSGSLSEDEQRIYVTTFNDNDASPLWAIDALDGSIVWSVPGFRGDPDKEMNFFGRPAVIGDRVYCGGAHGVVACYQDNGTSADLLWEYRDYDDEHTVISAVRTPDDKTYVYTSKQGLVITPNRGFFIAIEDEGTTGTKIFETDLGGTMLPTLYANNSATIGADGGVYIGGGNSFATAGADPGAVYKFGLAAAGLTLQQQGLCPGLIRIGVRDATPGSNVGFAYSTRAGSTPVPQCPGLTLDLRNPTVAGTARANAGGIAYVQGNVPGGACGRVMAQAVELGRCVKSNVLTIQ